MSPFLSRRDLLHGAALLPLASPRASRAATAQGAADGIAAEPIDASAIRVVCDLAGAESPCVLPDGSLVTVEFQKGQVVRVREDGRKTVLGEFGPAPVGTALGPDGKVYVVKLNPALTAKGQAGARGAGGAAVREGGAPRPDPVDSPGGVIRMDVDTGQGEWLYTEHQGKPLAGPDDIVFDRWGDVWFTDFGDFCIYRCTTDGRTIERVADVPGINGLTLSPDGARLYVMNARRFGYYAVSGRGTLARKDGIPEFHALADWPAGWAEPDGMKTEAGGNVVMGCRSDGLIVCSPEGRLVSQTRLPPYQPINMAFGGKDRRTLYVAAGVAGMTGKLLELPWPRPGARLATARR